MSKTPKLAEIKVRLKPSSKRSIRAWAKRLNLSVNKFVVAVLAHSVEEHEQDATRRTKQEEPCK
jgi:predicted HicB family RNase H-like nuclease